MNPRPAKDERPMCGQSAKPDRQVESSWSRDDHEDGGPTIQLPAAQPAAPLTCLRGIEYIHRRTAMFANNLRRRV